MRYWSLILLTLLSQSTFAAPKIGDLVLDEIQIEGVSHLSKEVAESAFELSPGDLIDREKVAKTAENLQGLYRTKGYEQIQVKSELLRVKSPKGEIDNILKVTVTEGEPTRIREIRFQSFGLASETDIEKWKTLEEPIRSKVGLKSGDVFDQERVLGTKRIVQEFLGASDYVGGKVEELRVRRKINSKPPVVDLEYTVSLGDRVSFGFRGNDFFNRSHLIALIDDQRVLGLGKDYIKSIRDRIIDDYKSEGFAGVQIRIYTFEHPEQSSRHVTYEINEGQRYAISGVDFDGNIAFLSDELRGEFFRLAPVIIQNQIFVEKYIQSTANLLVDWMKSRGYLGARLVTINHNEDTKRKRVNSTLFLFEGEQTLVRSISIDGIKFLTREDLSDRLGIHEGQPLNLFAFNEGLEKLKTFYRSKGYLDFQLTNEGQVGVVNYFDENRSADLQLLFNEGVRYKVGAIEIQGLHAVQEHVVRREIEIASGETIEASKIIDSEANLRRTGLFTGAQFRYDDISQNSEEKNLRVQLEEGTPGLLEGGVGFRNDLGTRLFGQASYNNIWHRNHTITLSGATNRRFEQYNFLEYQVQLTYHWPWFFDISRLSMRPKLAVEKTQYLNFGASTTSTGFTLERPMLRHPNLVAFTTYTIERTRQFQTNAQLDPIDNQTLTIGSIMPGLRLDMRDNPLAPTKGFYSSLSFELADPAFGSQSEPFPVGFSRTQLRSDYHQPLPFGLQGYFSFRTGFERNNESPPPEHPDDKRYSIPLVKQFALGGVGSLRGFREQELNVQDLAIRGTLSYVNYRFQVDVPMGGGLRFGPFLDAANLLVDRYSFGELRYGTGAGFRYITPVGPINFDWGFKIAPKPGEDPYRFYFSIGVI